MGKERSREGERIQLLASGKLTIPAKAGNEWSIPERESIVTTRKIKVFSRNYYCFFECIHCVDANLFVMPAEAGILLLC